METKGKSDVDEKKKKKRVDSCRRSDGEGVETVVVGCQGGLQAERHVNGERRSSLTRSLAWHFFFFLLAACPVQLLLCVVSNDNPPPLPSQAFF